MTIVGLPESIYQHYVYSYPHKSAYQRFDQPISLTDLWAAEDTSALYLYLHVPFCEFRCGFCNLFTRAVPPAELPKRYLQRVREEARIVRSQLGDATFARLAIGGGTPTFLDEHQLIELFSIAELMGVNPASVPTGIECSPATMSATKLKLLLDIGVERISIGVQSFSKPISGSLGRPNDIAVTCRTLDLLREQDLRCLNIDLIYGADQQSPQDFVESIETALRWHPEEIFLYPLYVRPLTGLGRTGIPPDMSQWDQQRLDCYRAGRDRLLGSGYRQTSMRMFVRSQQVELPRPAYSCQTDGMVGLGCGARSYTRAVHYSSEYAVGRTAIQAILDDYLVRDVSSFETANHGYWLDSEDQMRRFAILSLLQVEGLDIREFESQFQLKPQAVLPEISTLLESDLLQDTAGHLALTRAGLERSDQIGPYLFSAAVRNAMGAYECV